MRPADSVRLAGTLLLIVLACRPPAAGCAPEDADPSGYWKGAIQREGKPWSAALNIARDAEEWVASVDLPDAGIWRKKMGRLVLNENQFVLQGFMRNSPYRFQGRITEKSMSGSFKGEGVDAVFDFARTEDPFSGVREEAFPFRNGQVELSGTLLLPAGPFPAAVAVMTHGSGDQDRQTTYYSSRGYFFARHGVGALIYDKRGCGKSGGDWRSSSLIDLAGDALAAIDALKANPRIDPKRIGVSGFSQGGWIAPLAASSPERGVAFVIVGSAPGITPAAQNRFNLKSDLAAAEESAETIAEALSIHDAIDEFFTGRLGANEAETKLAAFSKIHAHKPWLKNYFPKVPLPRITPASPLRYSDSYMLFDPAPAWSRISVPVLAVWGAEDRIVPAAESLKILSGALASAGNENVTLRVFPNSGHGLLLVQAKDAPWDWPRLAPGYRALLDTWLRDWARPPASPPDP